MWYTAIIEIIWYGYLFCEKYKCSYFYSLLNILISSVHKQDGNKKIDLSKLSEDELAKLGIDVNNMTKEEIARALKVFIVLVRIFV